MANRMNWLQGKTVRKNTPAGSHSRSSSTPQVHSTSSTIFGGGVKDPSGRITEYSSDDDQCPVCKSDKYLERKLRLLVSSCYHKMCESCIDRLFTLGPAPCPICNKVLRKLAFTPQTFEDLGVEKEIAIRRRVAKEFNKRLEDFSSLRDFNDYLEDVEDITFNLINDVDPIETESRIAAYREANAALTLLNSQREEAYILSLRQAEELERKEKELRAEEARREEEEERQEKESGRREILERLERADGADAAKVVQRSKRERAEKEASRKGVAPGKGAQALLRARMAAAAATAATKDTPHIPFQDDYYAYNDMFVLQHVYVDPSSEAVRKDREGIMRAGGYRVEEAWERAVRSAVAGLDLLPLDHEIDAFHGMDQGGDVIMSAA
ncbi:CDK-activating kinase assembly factor MAT1-domain-containing protein [Mycena albidolilacea]|uniref:RNA polymerase II transcription factor B subunit 3 n=1 Tax=Mycena albidolilacea TaxID=1033008 RepID=A0AAD7A4C6_9AGAR|nr:CDK-activating kinase assembly factor MAT1-domain-containing protein [Mycena albidolilacea]